MPGENPIHSLTAVWGKSDPAQILGITKKKRKESIISITNQKNAFQNVAWGWGWKECLPFTIPPSNLAQHPSCHYLRSLSRCHYIESWGMMMWQEQCSLLGASRWSIFLPVSFLPWFQKHALLSTRDWAPADSLVLCYANIQVCQGAN